MILNVLRITSCLGLGCITLAAAERSWPQYRGANGDGISPETIATSWNGAAPKQLWRVETPAGFSSFSIDDGKAFTLVTRNLEGTPREVCLALDAASGKELWAAPVGVAKYPGGGDSGAADNKGGDGPRSTPTVSEGKVYVYSADMALYCMDAKSGKTEWSKDILKDFAGRNIDWKNAMSPIVRDQMLFLAGGGSGQSLLALDKSTGAVIWNSGDEKMTHTSPVFVSVHGTPQVVFFLQSGLLSVEPDTGKTLWKQPFEYRVSTASMPVFGGGMVLCTAGYDVGGAAYQISNTGGDWTTKELWRVKRNERVASLWSPPVYKDGHLYGMISFKRYGSGPLKCVDFQTGEVKWEKEGFGAGNVLLTRNALVALTDDGQIVMAKPSPEKYTELGRFKAVQGKCWSTPALVDGKLYVRSTREGACYDLAAR